jgi:hypothetical protein
MLMHEEDQNPPPTVEESYATAIGSSNLKHDPDRPNAVNVIIAAGISPHRLGAALMRLRTEWDSSAKPKPAMEEQIKALALSLQVTRRPPYVINPERMEDHVNHMSRAWCLDEARRQAAEWHSGELAKLLHRLKTLPMVRDALIHWATDQGIEGAPHVVAAVLLWWLNSICPVCKGVKKRVVQGTGRTGSKDCTECKGLGEIKVPHGFLGRKVLSFMNHCRIANSKHLRDMKWRHKPKG